MAAWAISGRREGRGIDSWRSRPRAWAATIRGCSTRMSGTTTARWRSNSIVSMVTVSRSAVARGASCAKPSGLAIRTPVSHRHCLPTEPQAEMLHRHLVGRVRPMPHARPAGETSPSPTLPPARPTPPLSRPERKASAASAAPQAPSSSEQAEHRSPTLAAAAPEAQKRAGDRNGRGEGKRSSRRIEGLPSDPQCLSLDMTGR